MDLEKRFRRALSLILIVIFVLCFCGTVETKEKPNYKKLQEKYNISQCFLRALEEESSFYPCDKTCRSLEKLFEEYADVYLVLMVYEKGERIAIAEYENGNVSEFALRVCEKSERYERKLEKKMLEKKNQVYKGEFVLTAYCSCSKCCGKYANGITASGTHCKQGRTIAMDKRFKFGQKVKIEGLGNFVNEDTGSCIKGNRIDVYFDSHSEALKFGVQKRKVYLISD